MPGRMLAELIEKYPDAGNDTVCGRRLDTLSKEELIAYLAFTEDHYRAELAEVQRQRDFFATLEVRTPSRPIGPEWLRRMLGLAGNPVSPILKSSRPEATSRKLIADEDLHIGGLLLLVGEQFVHEGRAVTRVVLARAGTTGDGWCNRLFGAALRNIRKGEVIDYDPEGKTADIISRDAAGPGW